MMLHENKVTWLFLDLKNKVLICFYFTTPAKITAKAVISQSQRALLFLNIKPRGEELRTY